ncbi:hypothetical protein [Nostoc punctiforme]|uniref:hypothetical protein n=1 Tax=Nostoc punctiforme TaxID=272131 RepID=UPI00059FC3A7|nr:hypothetical protein [Nostoc punctiforme]
MTRNLFWEKVTGFGLKVFSLPLPPEDDTTFPFSPKPKKYCLLGKKHELRSLVEQLYLTQL